MHRLLVETEQLQSNAPSLSKEAQNHLRVLRPKEGESVELFDGKGCWRVFSFRRGAANGNGGLVPVTDLQMLAHPSVSLTLFACVTKGSRWDWTIEKATELGLTRLIPVISDRTIVRIPSNERTSKLDRWRRIVEDAARQSDAKWLPEVLAPITFAESLELVRTTECLVGALMTPPPRPIGEVLADIGMGRDFAVYVGPEGDFTPQELATLLEIARPVSFGTTILRAETAAIYGLSAVKAHLDCLA